MLWQSKDVGLLAYFINQLKDSAEQRRAWERYHEVERFVQGGVCRHLQICRHFGQTPKWSRCEMCDVCGNAPEWLNEPVEDAAPGRKPRKKKKKAAVAQPVIPERLSEPRPVPPAISAPAAPPPPSPLPRPAAPAPDRELFEFLRQWRQRTAQRAAVPAYVVMSDASLNELVAKKPQNLRELLSVSGFGERKAELYGSEIFAALDAFRNGARAAVLRDEEESPAEATIRLLSEGKSFDEVAQIRGRQVSTVVNMVADLVEKGRLDYRMEWVGAAAHQQIEQVIGQFGSQWLKPLRDALPPEISADQIRLVVAYVRSRERSR